MITGIHHTSFSVSDMERSLAFYCDGLGFRVLSDRTVEGDFPSKVSGLDGAHLRIVHLRGHGQGLELIQYLNPKGNRTAPRPCDVGSAHLCYVVEAMDEEVRRLNGLGARFISEPQEVDGGPNAGRRCVYFLDPDGIVMELVEPKPT